MQAILKAKKVWVPVNRDHRTYKEVVSTTPKLILQQRNEENEWWKLAHTWISHNGLSINEIEARLTRDGLEDIVVSWLDVEVFIISKVVKR